jgi:hypothetical protein
MYAHVPMFNDPKAPKISKDETAPGEGENEGEGEGEGEEETKRKFIVSCGASDDPGNSLFADMMLLGFILVLYFLPCK